MVVWALNDIIIIISKNWNLKAQHNLHQNQILMDLSNEICYLSLWEAVMYNFFSAGNSNKFMQIIWLKKLFKVIWNHLGIRMTNRTKSNHKIQFDVKPNLLFEWHLSQNSQFWPQSLILCHFDVPLGHGFDQSNLKFDYLSF